MAEHPKEGESLADLFPNLSDPVFGRQHFCRVSVKRVWVGSDRV